MTKLSTFASVCALVLASAACLPANATVITFAPGDYDNTANTVGAGPTPVNNQTTGSFRDVYWWGQAYGGGSPGTGSPDFINSGQNLILNGNSAVVGGDNTALNFTGLRIPNGGASFLSIYDTTPGNNAQSNLFSATGGLTISADVLFANAANHSASAGVVALYGGGQDGLALLASNRPGTTDQPTLSLVFQQDNAPTTLTFANLSSTSFVGDTVPGVDIGSGSGDHWYRVVMNLSAVGDAYSVTGQFYNHTDATDPNSGLGSLITSLSWNGSLSNPGNLLDLTNPGEIGLMASTTVGFSDGVDTVHGGTGANPLNDNLGVSITNFSFPGGAVPEPSTWALMIMGFGGIGAALRRRRETAVTA
jgi:hypothetical protein